MRIRRDDPGPPPAGYPCTRKRGRLVTKGETVKEEPSVKPWLVVEDDDDIRNYVKVLFMTWGHAAIEFRDGKQTFAWLDKVEGGSHSGETCGDSIIYFI